MTSHARVVARLADLPDGTMRQVKLDDLDILLFRRGEDVFAVQATCPHAGGPLGEGVLHGDRVICPWHRAEFCLVTGACTEPPAVDDLRRFPVGLRDGEVLLLTEEPVHPEPGLPTERDPRRFVILGGGGAGAVAAQTLREHGFAGHLLLIDAEGALPYDRTLLSKYVLSGAEGGEKSPLQDEGFYHHHGIERRTGLVTALDPAAHTLHFADGSEYVYDAALIATGSVPNPPEFPGADLGNVFLLRNRADADRLVAVAAPGCRAVVIGASFIGMEVAASLRERGLEVTVVAGQREPFEAQLGAAIGAVFRKLHEEKGVAFRLGRRVERLDGEDAVTAALLDDGTRLPADLVVVGFGVRPATDFVQGLPRREDGGFDVDATLRLADDLYAAGDVAAFPLQGDGPHVRVEHWRVALQQGRIAARNMMDDALRYDAVPVFWTIQFMEALTYVGHGKGTDDLVVRGDLGKREFVAYYLRDGRVTAAAGWGRDADMSALIVLMQRRRNWTVGELHPADSSPAAVLANAEGRAGG